MKTIILACVAVAFIGCSSAEKKSDTTVSSTTNSEKSTSNGPVELKIVSPQPNEVVESGDVAVKFDLKNYEVQPNGPHIHVILDNEPYQPDYSVAEPFILKNVKPGVHTIRAFPARAWHESIKDPTAFASVTFFVGKKTGKPPVDFNADPLLTYSRPKGKYEGDKANKILFDFWVKNAELGKNEYKVKYKLDQQKPQVLDEWKPSYFENLTPGKHKLVVELIDKKGRPVKGKYNKTEREFEVEK